MESPTTRQTNTAKMIRAQRSASHRINEHDRDGHGGVERRILLDGGEFLVRHRHRAGQPQPRLILGREIEIGGGLADGVGRPLAGLELGIVELRLDFEEAQQLVGRRTRWPWTSSCQEKLAGWPAFTFSIALAASVIGQVMLSSVIWPPCTPSRPNCSA